MPIRRAKAVPPAVAPPGGIRRRWRRVAVPLIGAATSIVLILPALLFVVDPVGIQLLPPDAVQVTAAVGGTTLVGREITDARTVADLYARLNGLPAVRWRFGWVLGPPDPVGYTFRFTRWGMPVEVAMPDGDGCYPRRWFVGRYGYWDLHMDFTGAATRAITSEARLPLAAP